MFIYFFLHYRQLLNMSPGHCSRPLTILLITFLLLPSSSAYCPAKYSYQVCHQLYHLFEQALLASPPNLYKLREEYFPSSRSCPVYGHVGYNISYMYSTSFSYNTTPPCDGNHVNTPWLPIKHSKCIPWSSSAILAYIDPMYLNSFQINLLDRLFQNAGAVAANLSDCRNQYHQFSSMHVHLQLLLHLQEELPCLPSEAQVSAVLEDLTSWVMLNLAANSNYTNVVRVLAQCDICFSNTAANSQSLFMGGGSSSRVACLLIQKPHSGYLFWTQREICCLLLNCQEAALSMKLCSQYMWGGMLV